MALISDGPNLSFDIMENSGYDNVAAPLSRSESDPPILQGDADSSPTVRKKRRKKKRKGKSPPDSCSICENMIAESSVIIRDVNYDCSKSTVTETVVASDLDGRDNCAVLLPAPFGELRQRNVTNVMNEGSEETVTEESGNCRTDEKVKGETVEDRIAGNEINPEQRMELNGKKLQGQLDWRKLMTEDPNYMLPAEKSPMKYFLDEINAGNSLRSTTTIGNDKERERVYDTIFHLPWRCELLISFGFFVCFDTFLSLLTVMPIRIILSLSSFLKTRQFKRLSSAELSDFGCFVILLTGVTLLQQAGLVEFLAPHSMMQSFFPYFLLFHSRLGMLLFAQLVSNLPNQLPILLNCIIFDKLCQSFNGDVLQSLFNSADGLANCSPENILYWRWRFISDEALAIAASIIHSFILLVQAITLSTCIVSHNNALFSMLVSNNFAEIKSNVFKRYSKDNVQRLAYFDSVERFHISAFVLFVLAQNILEAEGNWFESYIYNVLVVYICEVMVDVIKHSFIAKFNGLKPIAFSEFLEDLCKQTLNIQTEDEKKNLTFIPLAPACVVIRVVQPVYEAQVGWNLNPNRNPMMVWIVVWKVVLLTMTVVILGSLKMMIGMGLRKYAAWYVRRRKLHLE